MTWEEQENFDRIYRQIWLLLEDFRMEDKDEDDVRAYYQDWLKTKESPFNDNFYFLSHIYELLQKELIKFKSNTNRYYELAEQLFKIMTKHYRYNPEYYALYHNANLINKRNKAGNNIVVSISTDCCSVCDKKLEKIEFTIDVAIERKLLPFDRCINPDGCTCHYEYRHLRTI